MLLVQDQYGQNSRKNFDTELQFKQNTSKHVFSDTKETWEIESGCEEVITSGNDTAGEDILLADPSNLPEEILESRRQINPRKKNVRFGNLDYNYVFDTSETSSNENEYFGDEYGYLEPGRRRSLHQDPEITGYKVKNHYRVAHKTKWRPQDCSYDKPSPEKMVSYIKSTEERATGVNEYDMHRIRRKEHHCGRHHCGDFDDITYKKPPNRPFMFECGDDVTTRCCDHWTENKNYVKMKPMSAGHKHICHMMDSDVDVKNHRKYRADVHYDPQGSYHAMMDRYCQEEFYDNPYSAKAKKKGLEVVQEQLSDSTYKIPCSKYSSQTITGELSVFPKKKSSEKLTNSSVSDWMYYSTKGNGNSVGERMGPPRIHKMRSRRTRMNRIKNGWKKALVQTVRDGSRNERVGLIVMGSKGPEFYAKNSKKSTGVMPFRKTKSFLDGSAQSFDVMTVDCKNVFLSSSEPAPKTNYAINDLVSPEDDEKMEEKIAEFSKNVNNIVKTSEEKFYKSLSSSEYPQKRKTTEEILKKAEEEEEEEEDKKDEKTDEMEKSTFSPLRLLPYETLSSRGSKTLRNKEKKISEESKAMADALNEQAKQYKENQSNLKDKEDAFLEELKELKDKYMQEDKKQETVVPNLSLWSMKLEQLSEKTETEQREVEENNKKNEEQKTEEKEKGGKDEMSQRDSVKSMEQINLSKQRRKKYFESMTEERKVDDEGDVPRSKPQSNTGTPKRTSRTNKWESPFEENKNSEGPDSNLISAVFRDLVENGCAISQEESENLQNIFNRVSKNTEVCSNDVRSSSSSDVINTIRESKLNVSPRSPTSLDDTKGGKVTKKEEKRGKTKGYYKESRSENIEGKGKECGDSENCLEEVSNRKMVKLINFFDDKALDLKINKQSQGKSKRKNHLENKMKFLRKALPSIAAENEAAHLKQLKKYIDRFIDRVEASTNSEFSKRKEARLRSKDSHSTDSSEVQVDAQKILDFVSNPFKKISSDVTINIAKKLTDALVQDKATKCQKNFSSSIKARKHSENETDEDGLLPCGVSSGSEQCEDPEPTYLKQFKKMRNEHLNNILLEVKRLSELLRFLDRCNRLHF